MIPVIVWGLIALAGVIGAGIAVSFWENIRAWAERTIPLMIPGIVMVAKGVLAGNLELVKEGWNYLKKVVIYEKRKNDYYKHERFEKISSSEVPDEIKKELEEKQKLVQSLEIRTST